MKKIIALVALACLCTAANAATYTFTVNAGTNVGNGTLHVNPTGFATSGNLVMTSGADTGTYALSSSGQAPTYSPFGTFIYDNMTYPSATSAPALDWYGLLFVGNGLELNIWGNGQGNPYSFYSSNGSYYNVASNAADFALHQTPIPAAFWLFGSALTGLLGIGKRKFAYAETLVTA